MTDSMFDPIRAAVDTVEAAATARVEELHAAMDARAAADAATIADLRAKLAELQPAGTVFGINLDHETPIATAVARYGSVPAAKLFDGGSGILPDVAGLVPGKRGQACFKPNMADLAAGRLNATVAAYIHKQLTAGVKELIITPWQEPNGELKKGSLALATYLDGCRQVAKVIQSDGERGRVFLGQTFTADNSRTGVDVPDTWILPPDQVGGTDWARLCLDQYANPAGARSYGGDPYATPYPTPATVIDEGYAQVVRTGYADNWGVSEWNCPWRRNVAGGDADHGKRLAYLRAHMDYLMGLEHKPRHVYLWVGHGVQFDQTFTTLAEYAFWKDWITRSA